METKKMVKPDTNANLKGFQSKDALDRAHPAKPDVDDDESNEPALGVESHDAHEHATEVADVSGEMKLVKVRSRAFIAPFRFGKMTVTLKANTETLVPLCVKRHLEEKGLI